MDTLFQALAMQATAYLEQNNEQKYSKHLWLAVFHPTSPLYVIHEINKNEQTNK